MALYEFACAACGHEFDRHIPVEQRDATFPCPACASPCSRRLSVVGGFRIGKGGRLKSPHDRSTGGTVGGTTHARVFGYGTRVPKTGGKW